MHQLNFRLSKAFCSCVMEGNWTDRQTSRRTYDRGEIEGVSERKDRIIVSNVRHQRTLSSPVPFKRNRLRCVRCVKISQHNKRKRQPIGMLGRSSGNHDWLLANASACVSCGFCLRNARNAYNASDCVWMETGFRVMLLYGFRHSRISDVSYCTGAVGSCQVGYRLDEKASIFCH